MESILALGHVLLDQRTMGLTLKASRAFVEALTTLWDNSVFLEPLRLKVWKLTLQMNYRLFFWAESLTSNSIQNNGEKSRNTDATAVRIF